MALGWLDLVGARAPRLLRGTGDLVALRVRLLPGRGRDELLLAAVTGESLREGLAAAEGSKGHAASHGVLRAVEELVPVLV